MNMFKKQILPACCALFFSSAAPGAVIDGPANIRERPNGRILASLNDGIPVVCESRVGEWYAIEIAVKVSPRSLEHGYIKKNTVLVTPSDKPVGKILNAVPLAYPQSYWDGVTGKIQGYTHAQNLKRPEDSCQARLE